MGHQGQKTDTGTAERSVYYMRGRGGLFLVLVIEEQDHEVLIHIL